MKLISYEHFPALGVKHGPFYVRQLMRAGKFPAPVKPPRRGHKSWWRENDVRAWVKQRARAGG
jgi:predicted DNA-binding transcriptional regulator AlpA